MTLQHILSTMHRKDASFLEGMQCRCPVLVVNQTDSTDDIYTEENEVQIRMISTLE